MSSSAVFDGCLGVVIEGEDLNRVSAGVFDAAVRYHDVRHTLRQQPVVDVLPAEGCSSIFSVTSKFRPPIKPLDAEVLEHDRGIKPI